MELKKLKKKKKTKWYKDLTKYCGRWLVEKSVKIATTENLEVDIFPNTETGSGGFAISVDDFWLDVLPTRQEAENLCNKMGWKFQRRRTNEIHSSTDN